MKKKQSKITVPLVLELNAVIELLIFIKTIVTEEEEFVEIQKARDEHYKRLSKKYPNHKKYIKETLDCALESDEN